jgi:malonyl-CoA/methylmalonyl-CoA synthetase
VASYLRGGLKKLENPLLYAADQLWGLSHDLPKDCPECAAEGDSPAALVYTSGTTGRSKGAILTHNNFAANAVNLLTCWQMTAADRLLLALPLFHVHGLGNGLHTWLACGYRVRLLERFRKETILDEFLRFRPTVFFGVPTMYERLLDAPPETAREIGAFMRLFVSGSAPLPAPTLERFHELYGHVILERYGMSETLMNTSNPYAGERRAGTVGKPLPGVSIRLADFETGNDAAGEEGGEILIQGPNVFPGYWRQPEATAAAFTRDGYFRSGDMAVRSADGYYTLQGRRHELIISGGFNIYPREIEEFLMEQSGVAEAAVVGESDELRGQVPIAYVVPSAGSEIDPEALAACCQRDLASFKAPRRFVVAESLPRNALGKVQKHLLTE